MNSAHMEFCSSVEWGTRVEDNILPWTLDGNSLGEDVLELGPGPGRTTDILSRLVPRLTAVELHEGLAEALRVRFEGSNVTVENADATSLPFEDGRFSSAVCLTMLHHVPTPELQNRVFAEAARVIRPGAAFIGSDSRDGADFRELHVGDICVPIDPGTLKSRLLAAGFETVEVRTSPERVGFLARKAG